MEITLLSWRRDITLAWRDVSVAWRDIKNLYTPLQAVSVTFPWALPLLYPLPLHLLWQKSSFIVQKRPHKNHRQRDALSLQLSLSILVRTLLDATVTLQNQKKHCNKPKLKKIKRNGNGNGNGKGHSKGNGNDTLTACKGVSKFNKLRYY